MPNKHFRNTRECNAMDWRTLPVCHSPRAACPVGHPWRSCGAHLASEPPYDRRKPPSGRGIVPHPLLSHTPPNRQASRTGKSAERHTGKNG